MNKIKRKFLSETALTVVRLVLIKIVCSTCIVAIIRLSDKGPRAEEKRGRGLKKNGE